MLGQTVSHYRIVDKIGAGGMGVVYKAEDARLNRFVAIKFLPAELAANEEARARFEREARAAASLNHRHICTVHDVGEFEGRPFLVMELLEGESLKERIAKGALEADELLEVAMQIATGLDAAHGQGIAHRDVKPANVFLSARTDVKVLDFGLAKLFSKTAKDIDLTEAGSPLGTVHYMSPEQAAGKPIDHRADLFSFGVVLFEMATGRVPFQADTAVAILQSVVHDPPPPLLHSRPDAPPELARIVDKLLEKDPEIRYQTAKGVLADLRRLKRDTTTGVAPVPAPPRGRDARGLLAAAAVIVAGAAAYVMFGGDGNGGEEAAPPVAKRHSQLTFVGTALTPNLSPDGKSVAYVEQSVETGRVLVRDLAGGREVELFKGDFAFNPRWSPEGAEIMCWGSRDGKLGSFLVPRLGGSVRRFWAGAYFGWSPDGSRLAGTFVNLIRIMVSDRKTGKYTPVDLEGSFKWIHGVDWCHAQDRLAVITDDGEQEILWTLRPDGGDQREIHRDTSALEQMWYPRFSHDGRSLYFARTGSHTADILKVDADPASTRPPIALLTGLECDGFYSIGPEGRRLAYSRTFRKTNLWAAERSAKEPTQLTKGTALVGTPSISPDGSTVAFPMRRQQTQNIFVTPIEGRPIRQLTFQEAECDTPVWSPDGQRIAFRSTQGGKTQVWGVRASGGAPGRVSDAEVSITGALAWAPSDTILAPAPDSRNWLALDPRGSEPRTLLKGNPILSYAACLSPDGRMLAFHIWNPVKPQSIWLVPMDEWKPAVLCTAKGRDSLIPLRFSPDGKKVYVVRVLGKTTQIVACDVTDRTVATVYRLPFEYEDTVKGWWPCAMTADAERFAFVDVQATSDIWLVENFDPAYAR